MDPVLDDVDHVEARIDGLEAAPRTALSGPTAPGRGRRGDRECAEEQEDEE